MSYTTATFTRLDQNSDGRLAIVLRYTGNDGEPPVEFVYPVDAAVLPTADFVRGLAMGRITILNNNLSFLAAALPAVGTVLDTTTPLPVPPVTTFGSYMAASAPFSPGVTPQDVFTITGSATKKIQIVRIGLTTVQTTAGQNAWSLVKRATANTGGTSALVTGVPTDDAFAAATATVRQYTVFPTLGSLIGAIWTGRIPSPIPASATGANVERRFDRLEMDSPVTLTGITDVVAWNLNGIALPTGLSVQASVWWNELSL